MRRKEQQPRPKEMLKATQSTMNQPFKFNVDRADLRCVFSCAFLTCLIFYTTIAEAQFRKSTTLPPKQLLEGEIVALLNELKITEIQRAPFMSPVPQNLPRLSISIKNIDGDLVPLDRGYRVTEHPLFDYFVSPGDAWTGSDGRNYASIPFTLVHRWVNCTFNGVIDFTYTKDSISNARANINQETCHFLKFDAEGDIDVRYVPESLGHDTLVEDYRDEKNSRLPVQSIEEFTKRHAVNFEDFLHGLPDDDDLTLAGVYFEGNHYSTACRTRGDDYPHCNHMLLTSFSTAKSAYPSVLLMQLAQEYGMEVYETKVSELIPETEQSPGDWSSVTFNHLIDMATGNYAIDLPMADPTPGNFYGLTDTATKLRDALSWPNKSKAGTRFNYQTADTYILVVALDRFVREKEKSNDSFSHLVENVYEPLGLSPEVMHTRRTFDDGKYNSGTAFGGMGMFWDRDSIVLLARFLNAGEGKIGSEQVLARQALQATLFHDTADLGMNMRMSGNRYNNGMWGTPAHLFDENLADCTVFVPNMSGLSGVKVFLMPNGLIFYYFNDAQAFPMESISAANAVKPFCEEH